MRWLLSILAVVGLAGALPILTPATAFACSCRYAPDGSEIIEHVSHAAAVFTGTATATRTDRRTAYYEFDVREVFAGDVGATTVVSSNTQSSACGLGFDIGDEYLVFVSSYETHGAPWSVERCSATTTSTNERTRQAAVTAYGEPHAPDPHHGSVGIDDVGTPRWWMLAAIGGAVWLTAVAVRRLRSDKK